MSSKKKIAIIGSGTGLSLAFFLSDYFDVTVFEKENRLGGHINSINIGGKTVEGGAEFLNPLYKNFFKLLDIIGVKKLSYQMSMELIDLTNNEKTIFSPNPGDLLKNFSGIDSFDELREDAKKLIDLKDLYYVVSTFDKKRIVTLHDYLKEIGKEDFGNRFLYKVVASSWGIDIDEAKKMLAHYALNYLGVGTTFYEIEGGLSKYIDALEKIITGKCKIEKEASIKKILKFNEKYTVYSNDCEYHDFDHVILCTSAEISQQIASDVIDPVTKNILSSVEYYDTTICFHENDDPMIDKHHVVHIKWDGKLALTTALKKWNSNIAKTWIGETNQNLLEKALQVVKYRHPYMYLSYYTAQEKMREINMLGSGIMFGSIMAGFDDSHESGITASLEIANILCSKYGLKNKLIELFTAEKTLCCC